MGGGGDYAAAAADRDDAAADRLDAQADRDDAYAGGYGGGYGDGPGFDDGNGGLIDSGAHWAGEKVQEVEDVPQDIDNFGDNVADAFDGGEAQQAYDDDAGW